MNAIVKKIRGTQTWQLTIDGVQKEVYNDYVPGLLEAYDQGATEFSVKYGAITRGFSREGIENFFVKK